MLRRIINFIVVLAIVIAISGIFIHLYNNSRNTTDNFDATNEIDSNSSKKKKKDTNSNEQSENNSNSNENNSESNGGSSSSKELDDEDVVDDSKKDNNVESNGTSSVSGNEVAVASTGTKENIYIAIVGGIIVLTGAGIILKTNRG